MPAESTSLWRGPWLGLPSAVAVCGVALLALALANSTAQIYALMLALGVAAALLGVAQWRRYGLRQAHNLIGLTMLCLVFPSLELLQWAQLHGYGDFWLLQCLIYAAFVSLGLFVAVKELGALEHEAQAHGLVFDCLMLSLAVSCAVILLLAPLLGAWVGRGGAITLLNLAYASTICFMVLAHLSLLLSTHKVWRWHDVMLLACTVHLAGFFVLKVVESLLPPTSALPWLRCACMSLTLAALFKLTYLVMPHVRRVLPPERPSELSRTSVAGSAMLVGALPLAYLLSHLLGLPAAPLLWWVVGGAVCSLTAVLRLLPLLNQVLLRGQQLKELAMRDPLTGLYNRRVLEPANAVAHGLGEQSGGEVLALYIDLDDFKSINDHYGHAIGDQLLCAVAAALLQQSAQWAQNHALKTLVARMGGDEFLLVISLLGRPLPPDEALQMANTLYQSLARWWDLQGSHPVYAKASVGYGLRPAKDWSQAIQGADMAMYQNKLVRSEPRALAPAAAHLVPLRQQMREWIYQALQQPTLALDLQPIVDAHTREVLSYEALARLDHPERSGERLYPDAFMGIITGDGLHALLCERVMATLAHFRGAWAHRRVAINVAPSLLTRPDGALWLHGLAQRYQLQTHELSLEITEQAELNNANFLSCLAQLHALGYLLALDDFGVGYSNLARISDIAFQVLKVDISVVNAAAAGDTSLLASIQTLALSRGLQVVAEGVSTPAHLDAVRRMGIGCVQGHWLAPPQRIDSMFMRRPDDGAAAA